MTQSLLTQEEYDKYSKIYTTYNPSGRRASDSNPPPCYIMGDSLTQNEIRIMNDGLDTVLKKAGLI